MRIASLVPSATESLFALGLGDSVVAVTHECDWPASVRELPQITRSVIPEGLPPVEIDARVRDLTARGEAIYELDSDELERLEPDLIVTQALCAVCAVSYDDVCSVAARLPSGPEVISLDPTSLEEVLSDLGRLAKACGVPESGATLRRALEERLVQVRKAVAEVDPRRCVALEWLDPPFAGGHWIPEMIAIAGGIDPLGAAREKSRTVGWQEVRDARADAVAVMPCGLYADDAASHARDRADDLRSLGARGVWAVDAASSFSRPGPRLVDGVELLAHLLHPDRAAPPADLAWVELPELAA
jgi:iron complex transport system substrate-binding protein